MAEYCADSNIEIKNLRLEGPKHPWDIKVDRSSLTLGNPFRMKSESERDEVCDKYEAFFNEELFDTAMQAELSFLWQTYIQYGRLNLFCWCAPKRCHAETIRDYLLRKENTDEQT